MARGSVNIFITAQLRSGSSHVAETLSRLTGNTIGYLTPQFSGTRANDEQSISHSDIQMMTHQGKWVFHGHFKGGQNHRYLLRAFKLKPIVLFRNIPDSLVSVKEQLDVGAQFPCFTKPEKWDSFSESTKWHWIMTYIASWFLDFQRSWMNHPEALLIYYEDIFTNPYEIYQSIFQHLGMEVPLRSEILEAHTAHRTNFNQGQLNRGSYIPKVWIQAFEELPR